MDKMLKVKDITTYLESIAPLYLQEPYDNAGLIVGDPDMEVDSAVIGLDAIPSLIDEAISIGSKLVITHHPIIFKGLKQINGKNYVEQAVIKAIKNDIALYAIHTNLDNVLQHGVNQSLAGLIGLEGLSILKPSSEISETIGAGVVGDLTHSIDIQDFMKRLTEIFGIKGFKHTAIHNNIVSRVAVCGGSGSFLIPEAIKKEADVFITADLKYHEFFDADGRLILIDIGHFESEKHTIELIYRLIINNFPNFAAHCTKVLTNPVFYYYGNYKTS